MDVDVDIDKGGGGCFQGVSDHASIHPGAEFISLFLVKFWDSIHIIMKR